MANDAPVVALVDGDPAHAFAHDGAVAARKLVDRADLAWSQIFAEVCDDARLPARELADACRRREGLAVRRQDFGKAAVLAEDQSSDREASRDAVGDALAAVASVDVDIPVARVQPRE